MKQDIIFMPLGGGQRVGASCYYLRLGDRNIILDAGVGKAGGIKYAPDFHALITSPYVQSMGQINQIYISHAHNDHVGYLLKLMKQASHSNVYMTEITKILSEFQLFERFETGDKRRNEDIKMLSEHLLERVMTVTYMQTIDFGSYKVTFYPAGHIFGAIMMLFETEKRKILYTGDYSLDSTPLTEGCLIPKDTDIDTVILCGLHAKHPDYVRKRNSLFQCADCVLRSVKEDGRSVMCHVPQLSKGIEFLKALNDRNTSHIPIYLDGSMMGMVAKMEKLSIPVLNQFNKLISDSFPAEPHIYVTSKQQLAGLSAYQYIQADFTLHEDFAEMKDFIKRINPRQVIIVHCEKERSVFDRTIEQEMMWDSESHTQFIFAQDREIYRL